MLNRNISLLKKYITFRLKSKPRGGHGIHSPFVYDLYTNCIDSKQKETRYDEIEALRKELLKNKSTMPRSDFGAGTKASESHDLTVGDVVKTSSTPPYMGELLYRLVKYFNAQSIIELGTSIGFGAMYLGSGNVNAKITTIEGDINRCKIAQDNFNKLGLSNVTLVNNDFDSEMPNLLTNSGEIDLIFIDGNHSAESTLKYFNFFSEKANDGTLIILDDIRWSQGMENTWYTICREKNVSISIDLFNCGLIFFRKGITKQNFKLRYGPF